MDSIIGKLLYIFFFCHFLWQNNAKTLADIYWLLWSEPDRNEMKHNIVFKKFIMKDIIYYFILRFDYIIIRANITISCKH